MSDSVNSSARDDGRTPSKSRRGRRALGLVLAMLVVLLGLSAFLLIRLLIPASTSSVADGSGSNGTSGVTWVRSLYGISDKPADQLNRAQAAVPAPDGTMWVTDSVHRAVLHFTADGHYIGEVTGPADAPLMSPSRLAIGPDGLLYVCDTSADVVRVLRTDNTDAGSFGIPKPVSVAVSNDKIVVGSIAGFAILDKTGKPLHVIGTRGKGDNQFDYVHGVAIGANGNIYVSDSYNNRLSAYTPDGKRLWIIRTGKPSNSATLVNGSLAVTATADAKLTGDNALQLPLGMTLDGAGRIVVVDMFDCSLAVFNTDGKFVGKYGEAGGDDGQFFYPVSVSYDPGRDWFAVADSMSNRVEVVRIPGSSNGGAAAAASIAVNRTMSGPMRALVVPFALVLVAVGVVFFLRATARRRRRRAIRPDVVVLDS